MREPNAVPHHNTIFRQLAGHLPWGTLERLIDEHDADRGVRKLPTKEFLLALLFAQVPEAHSLRDVEAMLESHDARRYHATLPRARRSTLADASALRPGAVFIGLLFAIMGKLGRNCARSLRTVCG